MYTSYSTHPLTNPQTCSTARQKASTQTPISRQTRLVHIQTRIDHQNNSSCPILQLCPARNNISHTMDTLHPPHSRRSTIRLLLFTNPSSMDSNRNRNNNNNNNNNRLSRVHLRPVMVQAHLHPS
jgi:hypothetical protein